MSLQRPSFKTGEKNYSIGVASSILDLSESKFRIHNQSFVRPVERPPHIYDFDSKVDYETESHASYKYS